MTQTRVLIVDDEEGMLEVCRDTMGKLSNVEILAESSGRRAAKLVATEEIDLMVADVCIPDLGGIELLRVARQHDPELAVLMITAHPTQETAVESMRLGATLQNNV